MHGLPNANSSLLASLNVEEKKRLINALYLLSKFPPQRHCGDVRNRGGGSHLHAHNGDVLGLDGGWDGLVHGCALCVAVGDPAGGSFPSLPGSPGKL